jgi:hypothetical protein
MILNLNTNVFLKLILLISYMYLFKNIIMSTFFAFRGLQSVSFMKYLTIVQQF